MKTRTNEPGYVKGIFLAFLILALHVVLVALVGVVVVFFNVAYQYRVWIFAGGIAIAMGIGIYLYQRLRRAGRSLGETLGSHGFDGQPVEINILGGLASVRLGAPSAAPRLEAVQASATHQLEDPESIRTRELLELARLLDSDLITREDYNQTKQRILETL